MKRNRLVSCLLAFIAVFAVVSCTQFDESGIQNELTSIKGRLSTLESKINGDLAGLGDIVSALKNSVIITSVTESEDSWTIVFSNGKTATLSKGGAAGVPSIGVKKDSDGIYYWTRNGQWLLDEGGKKLPVIETAGLAPLLKIEGGFWYLSTDSGKTWTKLGKATGEDGDAFFKEVTWDEKFVYFTMADGSKFVLRRGVGLVASIAVIPDYSDGAVKAGTGLFTIRFKVEPESAVESLLALDPKCFKLSAVYTLTKAAAGDFATLPVHEVGAKDGILTIITDGETLAREFAKNQLGVSAALFISDGDAFAVSTGYFPLWPKNDYLGHGYVDLGLESGNKFADMNLGADDSSAPGDFYAWGELSPKKNYDWATYAWCNGSSDYISKYNQTDGFKSFADNNYKDDVVRQKWGGEWRTPTEEDWKELMDESKYKWKWNYKSGKYGYEVTSKKSGYEGQSIFFPVTGYRSGQSSKDGNTGYYWYSTLKESGYQEAMCLELSSSGHSNSSMARAYGLAIRPVLGKYVPKTLTSLSLDSKTVTLAVGMVRHLNVIPMPENANIPKLVWNSDNGGLATVSEDGMVTAVSPGTATITVKAEGGSFSATCTVIVKSEAELAPEAVDLGLASGVKWASKNLGATVPEDYGDYFAWGETEPYYLPGHAYDNPCKDWKAGKEKGYHWTSYKWKGGEENEYLKYGSSGSLAPEDDAATVGWGEGWRTPSRAELEELLDLQVFSWTREEINGIEGVRITSRKNGNSIFLPAVAIRWDDRLGTYFGHQGVYLSSDLDGWWPFSIFFDTDTGAIGESFGVRHTGIPIRPVQGERATPPEPDPGYVDLGLPSGIKWAKCNLGANNPEEFGDYFAWGETAPYYESGTLSSPVWNSGKSKGYDWPSYSLSEGDWNLITKYCTNSYYGTVDNLTDLEAKDDAATAIRGSGWRMPTKEEFEELLNPANCLWSWTTLERVPGYKVTSQRNGNSIFLPAGGRFIEKEFEWGIVGYYWCSTLSEYSCNAYARHFYEDSWNEEDDDWLDEARCYGFSVRPVYYGQ